MEQVKPSRAMNTIDVYNDIFSVPDTELADGRS